jgi:hypothetical protein
MTKYIDDLPRRSLSREAFFRKLRSKTVYSRVARGWSHEDALTTPLHRNQHEYNGKRQSLHAWAREYNLNYHTLVQRIYFHKWPFERALTTPVKRKGATNGGE